MSRAAKERAELTARGVAVLEQLHALESVGVAKEFAIGPMSSYLVVAALQLAMRHPDVSEWTRSRWETIARQIASTFSGDTLTILMMGFDEDEDVVSVPDGGRAAMRKVAETHVRAEGKRTHE